ncbi:cytochrome P450 [Chondromyces apiculatus]|uniref:Putative cytochrome P450 hydroxylase n=1 Tax=Chondromyces apiculatus DSM 436 TaxID=1192034 RepID=A0A017T3H0_9BACT|nr:cytochrome P450 [Chondromyces apiculatus]EYF03076.1 putative cytochrome P450 hydroxylase [Chondromyces apiculatus DSM 436]
MPQETLFQESARVSNRANPYPLYAELRRTPVSRESDGTYVVSTYREVSSLLYDPRISADPRNSADPPPMYKNPNAPPPEPSFIQLDEPRHEHMRRLTMKHFGPPRSPGRISGMAARIGQLVDKLLGAHQGRQEIDIVQDLSYPLPVMVICDLLGVPLEDEPRFRDWSDILTSGLDPDPSLQNDPAFLQRIFKASAEIRVYMAELLKAHRRTPNDSMLSAFVNDPEARAQVTDGEFMSIAILLLIAGHETTVNLISNGVLTLLRHPDLLARLRREPELVPAAIEEVLRYEPPVQFRNRTTLADVSVAGVTIPKGAEIILLIAAANRDPLRFPDADRFIPDRTDNQHLSFGSGVHYCFGAPLARVEAQIALREIIRRLDGPVLAVDPPPYRFNPALRGPSHLVVNFERLTD